MNSINSVLSGLLSSLLLSLGFRQLAARFDTLAQSTATNTQQTQSAVACVPCKWQNSAAVACVPCKWQEV